MTLAAVCLWVLLLPLFPTQDGPMHRYYAHVFGSLLMHQQTYTAYQLRHPLPPYLTQYGLLLLFFHLFSFDGGEKVFTCLVLVCLAAGLRFSALQIGPRGRWVAALCSPLLLAWPLMMGFFNFTLAVGLSLFCLGFWQRIAARGGPALTGFIAVLAVLTVTHPVPLLLLMAFCGADLVVSFLARSPASSAGLWLRAHRLHWIALACSGVAAAFPALAVDKSKAGATLAHFGFSAPFLRTTLLLTGVSPYNSRSHDLWINLYRLALYLLFAGLMWTGGRAAIKALRDRCPNFGTTAFFATALLALALPFLPNQVNGSGYFSTRLVFVLWLGAFLAGAADREPAAGSRRLFAGAAVVCCLVTLVPAQLFVRPAAEQLSAIESQPLPSGVPGSLLLGQDQEDWVRFHYQLAFDPFEWAGVLPFVHTDEVALDTPWLELKITPLAAAPGGPELAQDLATTVAHKPGVANGPAVAGQSLPAEDRDRIVRESGFFLLSGTPAETARGLEQQLSPDEAAAFHCQAAKEWYVLCPRRSGSAQ